MSVIEEIRKEYETRGLNRDDLSSDPMEQFDQWFQLAIEKSPGSWCEPEAMTLSTCVNNFVTSRTVLLKENAEQSFVFFTNYDSEKGKQLEDNPNASLLFHWSWLARQVRITGTVGKTTREHSGTYFHSRPRGSQLGACVSSQSQELENRESLVQQRMTLESRYRNQSIPLPETWGGYRLAPTRFEFWQGRKDRMHDRFQYVRHDEDTPVGQQSPGWKIRRLYP